MIFRGQYRNEETSRVDNSSLQQLITIDLHDLEDDQSGDESGNTIQYLELAGSPLRLSVIDNAEDKFKQIRSKQAEINIYSGNGISLSTFAEGGDNRWYVEIYSEVEMLFIGFLSISDLREAFQPEPNVITLTATDGLGFLNDEPLIDFTGNTPTNEQKIIDILTWALARTGLNLPINAVVNWRERYAANLNSIDGEITIPVIFNSTGNQMLVHESDALNAFYVGQEIVITGTLSNNGTFHISDIEHGVDAIITLEESVSTESLINATIDLGVNNSSNSHFFEYAYLDSKTFEDEIGTCENCYSVLEKILYGCVIEQFQGAWWIVRIDEIEYDRPYYVTKFNSLGEWVENYQLDLKKYIGSGLQLSWMNEDAEVSLERPTKEVILNQSYDYPKEIICNIDFNRGTEITAPDLSAAESFGTYEIECWTLRRISGSITSTSYIKRIFVYGRETERYVVITPKSGTATPYDFIQSEKAIVETGDKVSVSVSFRYENDYSGGGNTVYPMTVFILGDDGNYYYWWHPTSTDINDFYWYNGGTSESNRYIPVIWDAGAVDETEWMSLSINSSAIPVSGKLYIGLMQGHQVTTGGTDQNIYYNNLSVNITPFINGTYALYTGEQHTVVQDEPNKYKSKIEKDIYIGEPPRISMKGCLLKLSSGVFVRTEGFYNAAIYPSGWTNSNQVKPFGEMLSFEVWNQFMRTMRKFEGTIDGLESDIEMPDIVHRYYLSDSDENTNYKRFMLLHFESDSDLCEWTGFLVEVHDTLKGKSYTGYSFKYISGNG